MITVTALAVPSTVTELGLFGTNVVTSSVPKVTYAWTSY